MVTGVQQSLFNQAEPPLFVYPTDLRKIYSHYTSNSGVYKRYNALRKFLNKRPDQRITVKELADWEDIPEAEIIKRIT